MEGRGFSLVEMMSALAIVAVVATVAGPGFRDFLRDCRRSTTLDGLVHAVHGARRLAAQSGQAVELCATHDGTRCSGARDWRGTLLLRPVEADGPTPRLLPRVASGPAQSVQSNRAALSFAPLTPAATTATLTVCDDRGPVQARSVIVSRSGRPRVSTRDASGRALVCP